MKLKLDRKSRIELLVFHFVIPEGIIDEIDSTDITKNIIKSFNKKDCDIGADIIWKT